METVKYFQTAAVVDENDTVRYFSTPKKRIFPRTKAIIGRKVQNCHPPESVNIVEEIIDAFKKGKKDHADFWLEIKGEFILIQYFALRDEKGNYKNPPRKRIYPQLQV